MDQHPPRAFNKRFHVDRCHTRTILLEKAFRFFNAVLQPLIVRNPATRVILRSFNFERFKKKAAEDLMEQVHPTQADGPGAASKSNASLVDNSHCHSSHPTNDFRLRRVIEVPDGLPRLRVRNCHELPLFELAPAAKVSVSQLDKVDGPLELGSPLPRADLSLARINLNQGPGPNQGVEGWIGGG